MKLLYLGHSCFLLRAENGTRIVIDPFTGIGYEMPRVAADFTVCTHGHYDHAYTAGVDCLRPAVTGAGEYALGGVRAEGVPSYHDEVHGAKRGKNTVFLFEADGARVCHMGDIGQPCTEEFVKKLGKVDVLLLPVGGTYTVDAKGAMEYVRALSPKITVPMHYAQGGNIDIAPPDAFLALAEKEGYRCSSCEELDTREASACKGGEVRIMERYDGKRTEDSGRL